MASMASTVSPASACSEPVLSEYYYSLSDEKSKRRYKQKLSLFNGSDPYVLWEKQLLNQSDPFPDFSYPDLYHYLIYSTSFVTFDEVKNYKSLTAYKYFIDGWVLETHWKNYSEIFLLVGKVKHSYSSSKLPLHPWVALRINGTVECGHCTCMAGLAETCSHVAAILYWLETAVRINIDTSCTSKPNKWLPPSLPNACKQIPYVTLEELESISQRQHAADVSSNMWEKIKKQQPSTEDLQQFFVQLNDVENRKPAILSLITPYNSKFVQSVEHLPPALQGKYSPSNAELSYTELISATNDICYTASESQIHHLEELTRGQANNKQWFKYRAGRITASQIYQIMHTNLHQPSLSLVRRICYPESYKFSTTATAYGCQHESDAREEYKSKMIKQHTEFEIKPCGFFVDGNDSYIGASPDGLIQCKCCGIGVLEIKCPFCAKEANSLSDVANRRKQFCLQHQPSGLQLSRSHQYYTQCQLQIHVTKRLYCDFVVWHHASVHIERLEPDNAFITEALIKAKQFFKLCILPELTGKWYTRQRNLDEIEVSSQDHEDEGTWCYCRESKGGSMVGCDNDKCAIKWFHLSCLGMSEAPSGKWMCPTCHPAKKQKLKKVK